MMADEKPINQSYMICDACVSETRAVQYCDDCSEYLCPQCLDFHKRQRKTLNHQLLKIPKCSTHVARDITQFCNDCYMFTCNKCIQQGHVSHNVCAIEETVQRISDLLPGSRNKIQDNKTLMKDTLSWINEAKQMMINKSCVLEKEINSRRENVINMANRKADQSVLDIRAVRSERSTLFDDTALQISTTLNECKPQASPSTVGPNYGAIIKKYLVIKEYQAIKHQIESSNKVLEKVSKVANLAPLDIEGDPSFMHQMERYTTAYFMVAKTRPLIDIKDETLAPKHGLVPGQIKTGSTESKFKNEPGIKSEMCKDSVYNTATCIKSEVKANITKVDFKTETNVKNGDRAKPDTQVASSVLQPRPYIGHQSNLCQRKNTKRCFQSNLFVSTDVDNQIKIKRPNCTQSSTIISEYKQHNLSQSNQDLTRTASVSVFKSSCLPSNAIQTHEISRATIYPALKNITSALTTSTKGAESNPMTVSMPPATYKCSTTAINPRTQHLAPVKLSVARGNRIPKLPGALTPAIVKSDNKQPSKVMNKAKVDIHSFPTSYVAVKTSHSVQGRNTPTKGESSEAANTYKSDKNRTCTISAPQLSTYNISSSTTSCVLQQPRRNALASSDSTIRVTSEAQVETIDTPGTASAPVSVNFGSSIQGQQIVTPILFPTEHISYPTQERPTAITNASLLHKTKMPDFYFIPKRVYLDSFIANKGSDFDVQLVTYRVDAMLLEILPAPFPKSRREQGRSVLTLTNTQHIIISDDGIHLYEHDICIKTVKHTRDGYVPDAIEFINKYIFATVCCCKGMIRYHESNTLAVINTHKLRLDEDTPVGPILLDPIFLYTKKGDWLISMQKDKLAQFTFEGRMKRIDPLHPDVLKCNKCTVCIDENDNVFGAFCEGDKSIYKFTLQGDKKIIASLDGDVSHILSAGVDNNGGLYVSYTSDDQEWIAKYAY